MPLKLWIILVLEKSCRLGEETNSSMSVLQSSLLTSKVWVCKAGMSDLKGIISMQSMLVGYLPLIL